MKYVIDGSNLFRRMDDGMMAVSACISGFEAICADWIMFFDKSIELFMSADLFTNPEKSKAFESLFAGGKQGKDKLVRQISEDSRKIFQYLRENYHDRVIVVPGGKKADSFIASIADMTNGCIVSCDTFTRGSDALLAEKYPFLKNHDRVCQFCKLQGNFFIEGTSVLHPIPTSCAEAIKQLKQSSAKRVSQLTMSEEVMKALQALPEACLAALAAKKARETTNGKPSWMKDVSGPSLLDIFKALFN